MGDSEGGQQGGQEGWNAGEGIPLAGNLPETIEGAQSTASGLSDQAHHLYDGGVGAAQDGIGAATGAVAADGAALHDTVSGGFEHASEAVHGFTSGTADHVRMALSEEDRLPWLESIESAEEYEAVDVKRVAAVVVAGLVALAAVVGGVWWGTHRGQDGAPVADGSTVAAPATPYKEAPKTPGGKTYAGTDDTSFAVSQGKTVQEHLADGSANAAAAVASDAAGAAGAAAAGAGAASASEASGTAAKPAHAAADDSGGAAAGGDTGTAGWSGGIVQIGAYYSQSRANQAWDQLSHGHDVLSGAKYRIVSGQIDTGTVWRLQLLTGAGGGAALCDKLKAAGLACQVKK